MINPQDFMNEQKASQMLSQGVPIENIVRDTGVPRNRVTAMLQNQGLEQSFVNSQQAPVMPNQASSGIPSLGDQVNPDVASVISPQESQEVGDDFAEYITDDLGFDPLTGDITDNPNKRQETGQTDALNMLENPSQQSVQDIIKTRGDILASDPTDFDMDQIYKAAEILQGKLKYGEDIPKPSEGLPWLMLASKLIKSGGEGDDWSTALSESALAYYTAKKSGDITYKKELRAADRQKFSDYNNLVMQFGMLDFKNKAAINAALRKSNLEAPKMYDISNNSTFTDKITIPLNSAAYSYYAKNFPENIRPSINGNKEAFTVKTKDGSILQTFLDQDDVNNWDPARNDGATLTPGHKEPTNLKFYNIKNSAGVAQPSRWLSPTQYDKRVNAGDQITFGSTSGTPKWVIDKSTGDGIWATDQQILANPDAYLDDSGMSFNVGADGEISFSTGTAGMQRLLKRGGIKAYNELVGVANSTQQAVFNYFSSAEEQDKILENFLQANPNAKDLPFNNFAGTAVKFADSLRINFESFSNALSAPLEQGGSTLYIGDEKVTKDALFTNFTNSESYAEFRESPLAKFFEDNGVVGGALDAALFDLALVGASTYSPNKGGLDLRAISDRDMLSFIKLQGGEAKTLNSFIDISNRFRRNLISRNRNSLKQLINPTNLIRITNENDGPDTKRINALKSTIENILGELDGYEVKYQESFTYGQGNPGELIVSNTYVVDESVDQDNPNVISYNPRILADGQTGQQFGFSKDYDLSTPTKLEGTFREILNKYTALKSRPQQLNAYFDNLVINLSEEEMIAFKIFLQKAPQTGN